MSVIKKINLWFDEHKIKVSIKPVLTLFGIIEFSFKPDELKDDVDAEIRNGASKMIRKMIKSGIINELQFEEGSKCLTKNSKNKTFNKYNESNSNKNNSELEKCLKTEIGITTNEFLDLLKNEINNS